MPRESLVPSWARPALDWLSSPGGVALVSALSLVLFVASIVALPWFVARLPADYFRERPDVPPSVIHDPSLRRLAHVGKNVLGGCLLLAGLAMLVLPGQGILTILMALVLLDFPGKRRLERKLVSRPRVLDALNSLRRRRGREPLVLD